MTETTGIPIDQIISELSNNEKSILITLKKLQTSEPGELERKSGLKSDTDVMNAAYWLKVKNLVSITEKVKTEVSLKSKQYASRDLPERRALKILNKMDGLGLEFLLEVKSAELKFKKIQKPGQITKKEQNAIF